MNSISDAKRNFYTLALANALAEGRSFALDIHQNILAAGTYTIDFVTERAMQIPIININTLSVHTHMDLISGGTYSLGSPSILTNLNLELNRPSSNLVSDIDEGVTIDAAGSIIRTRHLLGAGQGSQRSIVSGGSKIGTILAPTSQYAFTFTNADTVTQDYDIEIIMVEL